MSATPNTRPAGGPLPRQLAKYGAVGVSNTLIGFAIYIVSVELGVQYLIASTLAYGLGSLNGYVLNRRWTFRAGHIRHAQSASRYAAVQLGAIATNLAMLFALVHWLGVEKIVAQAVAALLVFALTFIANRIWSFGGEDVLAPAA